MKHKEIICSQCGEKVFIWLEGTNYLRCDKNNGGCGYVINSHPDIIDEYVKKFKDDKRKKEIHEVLEKFNGNDYYNLDGDMEIFYDEDKKWYLRYDSGYGKLEIKLRTVKNLIKDREEE